MIIHVHISGVDCSTHAIDAKTVTDAQRFLAAYDHEGSSVSVTAIAEDSIEAYSLLNKLRNREGQES